MSTRYDRDRLQSFVRFVWRRFLDDRCFETAGALSYTTVFALVPLLAAAFGILSMFPVFALWTQKISGFVFSNFVPSAGATVQDYLQRFAANASRMTVVGIAALLVSAILMMTSIEGRFNRIWRVAAQRRSTARFLMYWTALTLGPLLVVGGLALTSYLFALPLLHHADAQFALRARLLGLLPFLITWVGLFGMYILIPNRVVAWRHAATGALVAALLFELARFGFGLYVTYAAYGQIYGALAVLPIFLVWVYLSWVIVLLGASLTASLAAYRYCPQAARLPPGCEFIGLLRVLARFAAVQRQGAALSAATLLAVEPFLDDDLLQRYLLDLQRTAVVRRTERGDWMLARALDSITLAELYETGHYRLSTSAEAVASAAHGLPPGLTATLAQHARGLRENLQLTLAVLSPFAPPAPSAPESPR